MPSVSDIPWIRPAQTLQAGEAGAAAGSRNPLNVIGAMEAGASAGSRVAQMQNAAQESAARIAAQERQQAASNAQQAAMQTQRIEAEQQRTQQQMAQAKMELDARQQVQQQESLKAEQQLQIENARKQAELGLRQQQLQQAGQMAQQKAREAALDFADHAAFSQEVQAGGDPAKLIWNHPRVLKSSGTMNEAIRANIPKLDPTQFENVTKIMDVPEVPEQKGSPAIPEVKGAHFWNSDTPAKPAVPAVQGVPAYKVHSTRKVRIGQQDAAPSGDQPSAEAIAALKARPQNAAKFDKRFGAGAAAKILGGGSGDAGSDPAPNEQD